CNAGRWCRDRSVPKGECLVHDNSRPLSIPLILGTPRQGRLSEHVARVVIEEANARDDVRTELIDVRHLPLSAMDAGEQIKDSRFSETIMRADGLIIVAPEYNHGYPGMLKHALDSNLKEYIHKPVGLCLHLLRQARSAKGALFGKRKLPELLHHTARKTRAHRRRLDQPDEREEREPVERAFSHG